MLGVDNCGGFFTEEIQENGERIGFMIKTLSNKSAVLAHINIQSPYKISRYGVDLTTFEDICLNELEIAIKNSNVKYIIIDEIGPMQLFSEKYKQILLKLLNCDKPIIGTIFKNSYKWLDDFKKNKNVNLIEITYNNRNDLPIEIVDMVSKNNIDLQRKIQKAKRYSEEKDRFNIIDNKAIINSEHGIRTIVKENNKYICDCEFYNKNKTCSHIIAVINTLFL